MPLGQDAREHGAAVRKLDSGFDPVLRIETHHDAGLIVELSKIASDPQLGSKRRRGRESQEMAAVAAEPVMRRLPEIGGLVGDELEAVALRGPPFRLVQPNTVLSGEDGSTHVEPRGKIADQSCEKNEEPGAR